MTALVSMSRFDLDPGGIDAVLITHLHGDHYGGLPLMILEACINAHEGSTYPPRARRCASLVLPKPRRACAKCSTYSAGALNSPR
jgi:ribonuclease BN (tRNA processing enzyme)